MPIFFIVVIEFVNLSSDQYWNFTRSKIWKYSMMFLSPIYRVLETGKQKRGNEISIPLWSEEFKYKVFMSNRLTFWFWFWFCMIPSPITYNFFYLLGICFLWLLHSISFLFFWLSEADKVIWAPCVWQIQLPHSVNYMSCILCVCEAISNIILTFTI